MSYPGGKNGAGVYQKIINLMPPHSVYIEPFLGGGAIMRAKRPAWRNIGIDLDASVIAANIAANDYAAEVELINGCGIEYLEKYDWKGEELIYCDPPYPHQTRKQLNLYKHEMIEADHLRLLKAIKALPCYVIISSYDNPMYAEELDGWNYTSFPAMTRGGIRTESLWYNFPDPIALHDYRFMGDNFRERERIKRKKKRWASKLKNMPPLERQTILAAIDEAGIRQRQV